MTTIAIVDYGMCNLHSVWQAVLAAVGAENTTHQVLITSSPDAVRAAERIVLPGQGAMPDCMRELRDSGLQAAVLEAAQTKPLFGVCVGMQMLLESSEEGNTPGLGLIAGQVKKFKLSGQLQPDGSAYKVPQMGWNRVKQTANQRKQHQLWANVPDDNRFYFVHSFAAYTTHAAHAVGLTVYGDERAPFASAIARDNIFATQFHPEKSAAHGIQLYRNFLRWNP